LYGTSHRHAPVEVRERLTAGVPPAGEAAARIASLAGVAEGVVLSTCNRFEVVVVETARAEGLPDPVVRELSRWSGLAESELDSITYDLVDEAAAEHLFRVVSSLDSMILGESQITGQVKEAYRQASAAGACGRLLHRVFQKAFSVAKRVRTETDLGAATVSVAGAAVDLTRRIYEDLGRRSVLLLGAGEMAEVALRAFAAKGVQELWVSNRTQWRAAELAEAVGAGVLPWDRRHEFLARVDIVLAATAASAPVITRKDVAAVRRARRGRPLVLIDVSVPRNLDAALHRESGVYLYDIDDLGRSADLGKVKREKEAERAEASVASEVGRFARVLSQVHVAPLVRSMHGKVSGDVEHEVARTMSSLTGVLGPLGPEARGEIEAAMRRMANALGKRFLHHPIRRVKALGAEGELDRLADAADLLGVESTLLTVPSRGKQDDPAAPSDPAALKGGR
jgi:glutamyl-tRNA reductase